MALQRVATTESDLADLIARSADGDKSAFAALYDRTSAKLFAVIAGILGRSASAEDALQETYIAAWRFAGRFDGNRARPMTWLITIARNQAINRRRALARVEPGLDETMPDPIDDSPAPDHQAAARQEEGRLRDCMGTLEAGWADCVRLAYYEGCSHSEIAERSGRPIGTVKSWIRRGLMKLKDCLER